jgi:hypothetical protein
MQVVSLSLTICGGEFRNDLEQARRGGWRMTRGAGRRQGGDSSPLNRPEEEYAILSTGMHLICVIAIEELCRSDKRFFRLAIEMYTSIMYKIAYWK